MQVDLHVVEGYQTGVRYTVSTFPATVGRSPDATVTLQDDPQHPTISRKHIQLDVQGDDLFITDLSSHGTWREGQRLPRGERVLLNSGDSIWLGAHTRLLWSVADENTEETARTAGGPPAPWIKVDTLGRLEVVVNGRPFAWPSQRAAALLVYLVHQGTLVHVDRLRDDLWGDSDLPSLNAVQTAVSRIRRIIGSDTVVHRAGHYGMNDRYVLVYDVAAFNTACDQRSIERCRSLYRGAFLPGWNEPWVLQQRALLQERWLDVLQHHAEQAELKEARAVWQQILDIEPCRERGHRGLMESYARAGERDAVVRQYDSYVRAMKRHLDLPPSQAMTRFMQSLLEKP